MLPFAVARFSPAALVDAVRLAVIDSATAVESRPAIAEDGAAEVDMASGPDRSEEPAPPLTR